MKKILIFLLLITLSLAHPSWGIVITKNGDIYFVDILRKNGAMWKLDKDGKLSTILENFHAHSLTLDIHGNLWAGDAQWIREGQERHTLVKFTTNLTKETILVNSDYDVFNATSFAVNSKADIFFSINGHVSKYRENDIGEIIIDHKFKRIMNIFSDQKDNLWIADNNKDNGSIYKFTSEGKLIHFAKNILPLEPRDPIFPEKHVQIILGMYSDGTNSVYVSNNSSRSVDLFSENGKRQRIHKSEDKWYPVGLTKFGNEFYIMECGYDRKHFGPRIIKISSDKSKKILVDLSDQ